ncbi:hypothetical protein LTR78_009107 [Recurvomyces mirabilis]|uniref:Glutathione S-transferase UstS-like C-terminal domain-containing protein n=1 Tax=Recurvomyces mirabilis TaxID=574656 RepID=A0AAE0TS64_9PEZI|nr:hypothetical protein LTR78_009107 [Recurvomyces mirabilis]KAK5161045.1 hypothetical protein LTS14_000839 [Recurvomyces mirabilis]
MSEQVILYDLANRNGISWSPNVFKGRHRAKIQGTVSIPILSKTMHMLRWQCSGIKPNKPGSFANYSCPTLRFSDSSYVMGSEVLVDRLEQTYPEPSMHLNSNVHKLAEDICDRIMANAAPDFMVLVVDNWLQEPSKSWFAKDRIRRLGMTVQECRQKAGGEVARPKIEEVSAELRDLLSKHKTDEGPFILGSAVSYGDFVVGGLFEGLKRMDPEHYQTFIDYDQSFRKLHEAMKPWVQRDN